MSKTNIHWKRTPFKAGDRVKYIGKLTDNIFYPAVETSGTVLRNIDTEIVEIKWDCGVEQTDKNSGWYCENTDLEFIGFECLYCSKYPDLLMDKKDIKIRIKQKKLEIKTKEIQTFLPISYCIYCGRKIRK